MNASVAITDLTRQSGRILVKIMWARLQSGRIFVSNYRREPAESGEIGTALRHEAITVVYGVADEQYNQAVARKEFIDRLASTCLKEKE